MLYLLDWMDEIKLRLLSEDFGKHLMGVEDLLQKHTLMEADMKVLGERVETVNSSATRFVTCDDEDFQSLTPSDYKVSTSGCRLFYNSHYLHLLLLKFEINVKSCAFYRYRKSYCDFS